MSDQSEQNPGPNITLLKWIVSILGVLIVIFAAVIAVTIYQRMTATDTAKAPVESQPVSTMTSSNNDVGAALIQFGDVRVPLPDDMDVISLTASGERLFIVLGTEGAARLILVVSLLDGKTLGALNLERDGIQ
jgi:hypothetical protein